VTNNDQIIQHDSAGPRCCVAEHTCHFCHPYHHSSICAP